MKAKKFLSIVMSIAMMLSLFAVTVSAETPSDNWHDHVADSFESGNGTEADPYTIKTAQQLAKLSKDVLGGTDYAENYFKLEADIDLSGHRWIPIGVDMHTDDNNDIRKPFCGSFDGGNKTISNMYIDSALDGEYMPGLFGKISNYRQSPAGAVTTAPIIKNLTLDNSTVIYKLNSGHENFISGVFAAMVDGNASPQVQIENITVSNSTITNELSNADEYYQSGGFAGYIDYASVKNCKTVNTTVTGGANNGGFVGTSFGASYENCSADGAVSGNWALGGFAGYALEANFEKCTADVDVTANDWNVGGFCGLAEYGGSFEKCVAYGKVKSTVSGWQPKQGGFAGSLIEYPMTNCYFAGTLESAHTTIKPSGLAAYVESSTITDSAYDGQLNTDIVGYTGETASTALSTKALGTAICENVIGHTMEDGTCSNCGYVAYNIYVGGIEITNLNASDVLGNGKVSYNADTNTLTISEISIDGDIVFNESTPTIKLSGNVSVAGNINTTASSLTITSENSTAPEFTLVGSIDSAVTDLKLENIVYKQGISLPLTTLTLNNAEVKGDIGITAENPTIKLVGTNNAETIRLETTTDGKAVITSVDTSSKGSLNATGIENSSVKNLNLELDSVIYEGDFYNPNIGHKDTLVFKNSEVTTSNMGWMSGTTEAGVTYGGIQLTNSTLTVNNTFWAERIVMDDSSLINMNTALSNYGSQVSLEEALGSIKNYLPAGYSINNSPGVFEGNSIVLTSTGEKASGIVIKKYEPVSTPSIGGGGGVVRYTVKFETNGGSKISNSSVIKNKTLAEPETPKKEGYTFDGWYTDKELTTAYDFNSKVTKGFTLYAKWTENSEENENESENESESGTGGHNCPSLKFNDLDITQWYHLNTDYVIENEIFKGMTENVFAPNGLITRAMMVTVLYRAEGEPEVTGETTFQDIDENDYYAKALIWGQQNGIIKGYSDTEFRPNEAIIREQIAAIMHRYAIYKGYDVSVGENTNILSYEDFDSISEYAIPSVQYAVGIGIIKGRTDSTINPQDFATRAEIAAMLHRFLEANE